MADISEPTAIHRVQSSDKRPKDQGQPKKQAREPVAPPPPVAPGARDIHDVTEIMGIPVEEMTPKVQETLTLIMAEFDRQRAELDHARAHNKYLEEMAETHSFLPLVNRRGLHRELSRMLDLAQRTGIDDVFVCLHATNIEDIRRTLGHDAAEAAMRRVAEALIGAVHAIDVLGSLGGYDFGAIVTLAEGETGVIRAQALADAVSAAGFSWAGRALTLEAAFGIAAFAAGDTSETVLQRADRDLLARASGA